MRQLATGDSVGVYDILGLVTNNVIGVYDIRQIAFNDSIGVYDINGLVAQSSIYLYDVTGQVFNDLGGCYDINGVASAIIQKQTKKVQLMQLNVESNVVVKTDGAFNYSCWIFLDELQAGESVEIRTYVWNPQDNIYELYESPIITKAGLAGSETNDTADDKTAFFLPPVQSDRVKITITQLSGTPRAFDWVLYKQ
jgi:hypothetical protein